MTTTWRALRPVAVLVAAALPGACDGLTVVDDAVGAPVVRTEVASVAPGGTVLLLLSNPTETAWDYGACSYQVDRLDAGAWVMVDNPLLRACTMQAFSLGRGDQDELAVKVPAVEGTYRVRFRLVHFPGDLAEGVWVTSNAFRVGSSTLPD